MGNSFGKKVIAGIASFAVLAVVSAPLTASAITSNTTVSALVNSTITMTTSGTVNLTLNPGPSPVVSSNSDTVTINCNSTAGYTLTIQDADAVRNLVSGGNTITPHAGTPAAPTALANGTWGFAVAGAPFDASYNPESSSTTSTSKWAGIPTNGSAHTLKNTSAVATNEVTTVWYGARITSAQPTGTYNDSILYTALAK